jgi:hypothetical protein
MKKNFNCRWSASSRALLLRLLFENIQSKMHLACSEGTAELAGGGGGGKGVGGTVLDGQVAGTTKLWGV